MLPLIVLLTVFCISFFVVRVKTQKNNVQLSASIAMCVMLVFTATGHFIYTKGMAMMLPDIIPYKIQIIYLSGLIEIILGFGLLVPGVKSYFAWLIILFFIAVLPANIYAAINNIDYQKGSFDGYGLSYLWFRVPLQLFFIAWVYWSTFHIKKNSKKKNILEINDLIEQKIIMHN